jgi:hypothetical protein
MTTLWQSWSPIFNWGCLYDIPKDGIDFAEGMRIEILPDWVRSEEAVRHLHVSHRTKILRYVVYGFKLDYEAASLGDPDPDYLGDEPRSKQNRAVELFNLANLALWIVKPNPISLPTFFHFDRPGDPKSVRSSGSSLGFLHHERDSDNKLSKNDVDLATKLHRVLFNLNRQEAVWIASRLLWKSLFERLWEVRVLIQWVAIEAIFGPPGGGELTYRISQRIGFFLGEDRKDSKRINDKAKHYYGWRSKIVHGSKLNKISNEKSLEVSYASQEYIRKALLKILQSQELIDVINSKNREKYLDDLIFEG